MSYPGQLTWNRSACWGAAVSLLVAKRTVRKQECRNELKRWDQATSRERRFGGNQLHSRDQATRRDEQTNGAQGSRSKQLFQIGRHHHRASRARCIAGLSGFLTLIQSREGPER
jgi:hypothetical protein